MDEFCEGRYSDSPFIEMVWRGSASADYKPTCPADACWDLLLLKKGKQVEVSVEGPLTRALYKTSVGETECLVIKFKLGVFIPYFPVNSITDRKTVLPEGARHSFWLMGSTWQFPDFDNVETFVHRLVHQDVLVRDPVVSAVLQSQTPHMSSRTVRRRFLQATGLTPKAIEQIERAKQAATLLGQGVSILDTTYAAGYADQPHLTRSLRRFYGQTPTQIAQMSAVG